ncbi:hypothetical protein GCM10008938_45910 [Deinococcus roseus]|uniref:histidine kinase n=1 Tax=Deinococcus roseus TaxID=392414 RepID=A0ABQ2DDY7_9DEIO|nr:hypothetical protein GCM10008938_45910 [Deinococcus roseus]
MLLTGAMLLSSLSVMVLILFVVRTELHLVVQSLPAGVRQVFEQRWQALQQGTDPTLDFDLPWYVLVMLLLPLLLLFWLWKKVQQHLVRPLQQVSRAARTLAQGNLRITGLNPTGSGEVGQLQQDVQHLSQQLQHLQQEREYSTAAIAHELRTPLAVLQARLQAHLDQVLPLDDEAVGLLLQQVLALGRLTEDLRILSLSEVGQLDLKPEVLDLKAWVQGWHAGTALHLQGSIELVLPRAPLQVRVDASRLRQILGNLCQNAAVHGGSHGIQIHLQQDGPFACLQVLDQGPGFPAGEEERVFQRYHRTDASRSRHTGGSGLGLSVVKSLVELHGGRVQATNRPEGGACVMVWLPLHM